MLGAVGALAVHAETSLRIGIDAVRPSSQRATCGAYNIVSARELLERRPGLGDGRSLRELTFSRAASARQMNRGACTPNETVSRS